MKVSIIVPIHNVKKYLEKCVLSLVNQTYKDLQIILIDDGSTDGSGVKCDQLAVFDKRIEVYHQLKQGVSGSRNFGIRMAVGERILFVDSDDWLESDYVDNCVQQIRNYNNPDLLFTPYIREYRHRSLKNHLLSHNEFFGERETKCLLRRIIGEVNDELLNPGKINDFSTVWGKFYSAKICKKIKFIDIQKIESEDLIFNVFFISKIKNAFYYDEKFYHYNKENGNSLVHTYEPYLIGASKLKYDILNNFIIQNKLDKLCKAALNNRIVIESPFLISRISSSSLFVLKKIKLIYKIEREPLLRHAFKNFEFKYLKLPWLIIYKMIYYKQSLILLFITKVGNKVKGYIKK